MADRQLAIRSEREGGQAVLAATVANIDGAQADQLVTPAGFGDSYIIRAGIYVTNIATLMTNPQQNGPSGWLLEVGGNFADFLFSELWVTGYAGLTLSAVWQPLIAPLWCDSEKVQVEYAEVDTNAAPTADVTYLLLVQRRRNMPSEFAGAAAERLPVVFTS